MNYLKFTPQLEQRQQLTFSNTATLHKGSLSHYHARIKIQHQSDGALLIRHFAIGWTRENEVGCPLRARWYLAAIKELC